MAVSGIINISEAKEENRDGTVFMVKQLPDTNLNVVVCVVLEKGFA